jgi:hypothetical protein
LPLTDNPAEMSVHYIGPSVEDGRIDLFVLADGLRGLGRLTSRVSYLMYGSEFDHRLELDEGVRRGSIIIPLHIFSEAVQHAENVLSSKGAQALAALMGILGWGVIPTTLSVFKLFKRKHGRQITEGDDLSRILEGIENIERLLLLKVYNDQEVQAAIRATLKPLRTEGIEEFQTRRGNMIIESVTSRDLRLADEAEVSAIQEVEEKTLDIEKAALVPHLAWHFSDAGKSFDAKIHDIDLWARIASGERFGLGDRMRVELRTSFFRDATGRLNIERVIPHVIEVEHATPIQRNLWSGSEES